MDRHTGLSSHIGRNFSVITICVVIREQVELPMLDSKAVMIQVLIEAFKDVHIKP